MLSKAWSAAIKGIDAYSIHIEVDASNNDTDDDNNGVVIIGLPDNAVKESRARVRSAIFNCGLKHPKGYTVISLSPADMKKEGAAFDLPIAVALIAACIDGDLDRQSLNGVMMVGELALDGSVRPVKGVLPIALHAKAAGAHALLVPEANAKEAAIYSDLPVFAIHNLLQAVELLKNPMLYQPEPVQSLEELFKKSESDVDFSDVKGQSLAKRALEIAAAGSHNLLMIGPPGSGKSMLAKRLSTILPKLTFEEALEVTKVHSIGGLLKSGKPFVTSRPFRSPHHTVSDVGLLGGGSHPQPGEVSFAHNGVLFLDELPEFKRGVLEVMRQPLEGGTVCITRAAGSFDFPAEFMLIAAMNPCPCGYYTGDSLRCKCTSHQVSKYRDKISGPLLDRIDIHIEVSALNEDELMSKRTGEASDSIADRVEKARDIQTLRYEGTNIYANSQMGAKELDLFCQLGTEEKNVLRGAIYDLQLSARAYDRILKLARTIADLDESMDINLAHLSEAIQYRNMDRQNW